jgi:hypothetical protein
MFAALSDDGRLASVKATRQERAALIAAAPETFGVPAYVGRHGWVSIRLATVDPTELGELVARRGARPPPDAWSPSTTPAETPGRPGRGDQGSG